MNGFDPATPNTARVYSRLLGGKDHFPPDRAEADVLLEIYPPLAEMVKENRAFIAEAVTWAASAGIGQFLDLGAGLPAFPAVHQTARTILPGAQVAYVDTDRCKSGCAHARKRPIPVSFPVQVVFDPGMDPVGGVNVGVLPPPAFRRLRQVGHPQLLAVAAAISTS